MNLDFPVTRTKILIPRRRTEIVTRQRLLETLNELLDNKMMILAAPAGYGKTSLLIDFIHHSELPFCWYSLDNLDRDPQRFIAHFISAINLRFPKFGQSSALALNNSSQDHLNVDSLVTTIINDAYENIREHFVIVLDDYHLVRDSKQVDHFISRFIQDVDENCHLVIASRTLLTLPDLPLMVARSQVGGISFEELAFRAEEIQTFMAQNNKKEISEEEAAQLAHQTEGWITGLLLSTQMAGKDADTRTRVTKVSGIGLYEYLAEQVLGQQPEDMQEFLLRTSLMEEFDIDTCQDVIGKSLDIDHIDWEPYFDILNRNFLFVLPVGDESIYLRYHHLFRDFLRERMARQRPEETRRIQLRLAEVYLDRGDWDQAFAIYKQFGQAESIATLAEKAGPAMVVRGQLEKLTGWLNTLPAGLLNSRPALLSLQASMLTINGDTRGSLVLLDKAIPALDTGEPSHQLLIALVRRSASHRLLAEYTPALEDAERVIEITTQAGNEDFADVQAEALRSKGIILFNQGQLSDALTWFNRSLDAYQQLNDDANAAKVCLEVGKVNEALGRYSAAMEAYERALKIWQVGGNKIWQANLLNNMGVLYHLMGNYETAAANLNEAVELARNETSYPRMEAFALTSIGDLYRDLEATSEALGAYNYARLIARQIMDRFLLMYLDLAEAGLARSQGQFFQASELLASAQQLAEESRSPYEHYLCLMESGCLKVARKDYSQASRDLEEAARYFINEGYRVESIRAQLYLMVASFAVINHAKAMEHLVQLLSIASNRENKPVAAGVARVQDYPFRSNHDIEFAHPLITSGREVRDHLIHISEKAEFYNLLTDLLTHIDQFEIEVPRIRRNLRRRSIAVALAPPKMIIRSLGRTAVKINDHTISSNEWQTQSCRDLFFLILNHPEGLTKENVGAIFWPEASPAELKLRFKNNVYRVRHAVGKDAIYFQDDYYYFNRQIDYEYDAEVFQHEISLAEEKPKPDENLDQVRARKLEHYQTSLKHYKGAYLPEFQETWATTERERLQKLYLETVLKVAEIYQQMKQYEMAISYCQRALKDDPSLEAAHRLAMTIYAEMGSRASVVRQFEECRRALLEDIDAPPSAQTQELFELLMR